MENRIYIPNVPEGEFFCSVNGLDISVTYSIFPIEVYQDLQKPIHTHSCYEMLCVFDGSYTFECDGEKILLEEGDTVIISPNFAHKNNGPEKCVVCRIGLTFKKKKNYDYIFKTFEKEMSSNQYVIVRKDECPAFKEAFNHFADCIGSPYRLTPSLISLFFLICEFISSKSTLTSKNNFYGVNKTDAIVNALIYTYTTDISAKYLAKKMFISERQVNRICHKAFGRSFNQQKNHFRIENAKNLLVNTNKTVLEISVDCGFSSESNFYSNFLKSEGTTPKKYRETNLKK